MWVCVRWSNKIIGVGLFRRTEVKKVFLIGILEKHMTYIFTLLKVESYLRIATLLLFTKFI